MSLLDSIIKDQGGQVLAQMAQKFNLQPKQAQSALQQLLPALTQGMQKNVAKQGGIDALLGALKSGGHQKFLDQIGQIPKQEQIQAGNGILGHLLGSKEVSRQVASDAARKTGLDVGMLKSMLPIAATMLMGQMSKKTEKAGLLENISAATGGQAMQMIAGMLGGDKKQNAMSGIFNMAKGFLRR